jgi:rhodanese-related sulfurtransferase
MARPVPTVISWCCVLMLISLVSLLGCGRDLGLDTVERMVRSEYPQVRQLSTDSLATWLEAPTQEEPLLLDVRTDAEYAVSHLPGAQRVNPDAEHFIFLENVPHDAPLVTYCSLGYRSSALTARLQEAGYTNVMNLEGSIFAWANEGRPVYRDGEMVNEVHPYNSRWGLLLKPSLRADVPAVGSNEAPPA